MKTIQALEAGDASKLSLIETEIPVPNENEVLVKISYAGVNFMDVGTRQGMLKNSFSFPVKLGVEGSGIVERVGSNVKGFKAGDRVAWVFAWGSYAEYIAIHEDSLVSIPAGISDEMAAAIMMQGITASHFATYFYETKPGDIALVNAAAGGVGLLLTQITKLRGGIVIGRVSHESKVETVKRAGADYVIVAKDKFSDAVKRITNGHGVDIVYDGSGPATFSESANSLRPTGTFCWYGPVLGGRGPIDLMDLPHSIKIGYATFMDHIRTPEDLRKVTAQLFEWVKDGKLKVKVHKIYNLAHAAEAHMDMEGRFTEGKLLLKA